jgi:hypothetical protein
MIVPRDINWHMAAANPESNGFTSIGLYLGNSTGSQSQNLSPDSAGYRSIGRTTGATANTGVGVVTTHDIVAINPSFRAIFGLSATTNARCYVGLMSYDNPTMAMSDPGGSSVAFVGFRYLDSSDGGNWFAYCGDYNHSNVMDTGVAVNTSHLQVLDVIWVSGVPQFFVGGVRVASGIDTTYLPDSTVSLGAVAIHASTTTTAIVGNLNQLYYGSD